VSIRLTTSGSNIKRRLSSSSLRESNETLMSSSFLSVSQVEVRGNDSRIHAEMDFTANISSIVLNNLTLGRVYWVRVAAFTAAGPGIFSEPVELSMDLLFLDARSEHNGVTAETGGGGGGGSWSQLVKEPWFIILMGVLLMVLFFLLTITLYSKRKSHGKKDQISSEFLSSCSEESNDDKVKAWRKIFCSMQE
jgi:hypothetical protein